MNFEFTEEQSMVRESLGRLLTDKYDFEARSKIIASEEGWSQDIWTSLAEMGIMAAAFDETYDGFGGTASDTLVIMEELGKANIIEPYLPTVILCGKTLAQVGGDAASDLIAQISAGELVMGLGHYEPKSRSRQSFVETTANLDGDTYVISGHKSVVLAAPIANKFIISARTGGETGDESGISLFVVDAKAPGVTVQGYANIDGHLAGDVMFDGVKVSKDALLGDAGMGYAPLAAALDHGRFAITAEGIGLCKAMCLLTNEYIQQRKQFGVPISKFQVLQHKMVDMFINQEELVSMAFMACANMDTDGKDPSQAITAAKVQLGKSLKFVGENAVQLHGGMGITEEMSVGHYFMRGTLLELMFGNTDFHVGRFMRESAAA